MATIAGTVAAVVTVFLMIWQSARSRRERQLQQARRVSTQLAWIAEGPTVRIRNDGDEQITDVWLRIPGDATNAHHFSAIPPHASVAAYVAEDDATRSHPNWYVAHVGCGGPASATEPRCQLTFVDHCGTRWSRIGTESPQRIDESMRQRFTDVH